MRTPLLTAVAAFLVVGCSESPTATVDDLVEPQFGSLELVGDGPVFLTGYSIFGAYLSRTQEWFLDPVFVRCPAEAELTLAGGHDVVLITTEGGPCGGRVITWYGTMTPGGALRLNMPDVLANEVMEHTGCTPSGPFPVYHGHFDGDVLNLRGEFHGHCDGGTIWGPSFGFPENPGPVHVNFGWEFTRD